MPVVQLSNRAVLRLAGPDAKTFLQGLVSHDVMLAKPDQAVYAALLTPQGKFLHDMFIQESADGLLLDAEASRLSDLQRRLQHFKLRAKVTITHELNLHVYAGWNTPQPDNALIDPRLSMLGWRVMTDHMPEDSTFDDYDCHRLRLGVADGSRDLEIEKTTLQEGNFDLLNGISFTKGCYIGQELTARIHYRGLVKQRLLPLEFTQWTPSSGCEIMLGETCVGRIRTRNKELALGLINLGALQSGERLITASGISGKIIIPEWFNLGS